MSTNKRHPNNWYSACDTMYVDVGLPQRQQDIPTTHYNIQSPCKSCIPLERRIWCIIIAILFIFVIGFVYLSDSCYSSLIIFILWTISCALLIIAIIFTQNTLIAIVLFLLLLIFMLKWTGRGSMIITSTLIIIISVALLTQCTNSIGIYALLGFIIAWLGLIALRITKYDTYGRH